MSRTPLKELSQSTLNQESNLLKSPAPILKRTPTKSRYEITNRSISDLNFNISNSKEAAISKLIIKQQQRQINQLQKKVVFLQLKDLLNRKQRQSKATKHLSVKDDPEGKFATPKKRKLVDENIENVVQNVQQSTLPPSLPNPPLFPSPNHRVPFPPDVQETKETEKEKPPSTHKHLLPSPKLQFQELSKLLDGMEDEAVLQDRKTEKLKKIYQTCSKNSPKPSRNEHQYCSPTSERNDYAAEFLSPNYGFKKSAFLTNITKQHGPVSLAELPAYKEKINSWKHKYC